ncbi:MAG: acylphosphatase [Pseudomonadota bacterium]
MTKTIRVSIFGRVQGVGYRVWTEQRARQLGLAGWVRNRLDGSVEAVFSGDKGVIAQMVRACEEGPSVARVERVKQQREDAQANQDFKILPTC